MSGKGQHASLSLEELLSVVYDSVSQDPTKIKDSAGRLKVMLDMTGSFDALSEIAAQRALPLQVRQQSIIQLKNAVTNHWRSRRLVPPEQRERIKARCLALISEPDDLISECNQLITAKIARQDFPASWPSLISDLLNIVDTNFASRYVGGPSEFLPLRRALELLSAIIKELSNAKMMLGIKIMAQVVETTHMKLQGYYSAIAPSLQGLKDSTVANPRSAEDILLAHLTFKCLSKCAGWSYQRVKSADEKAQIEPWLHELFQSMVLQLQSLSELRFQITSSLHNGSGTWDLITTQSITYLTRHIYMFGKFFRRLLQLDAPRFVGLPLSGDLIFYYWSKVVQATGFQSGAYIANSTTAVFPIRFLVQGMVIFKDSVAQWSPTRKDGRVGGQALSREFVEEAVKLLVTRFIPLNPSDLEEWMDDPEEWVNIEERENDQWEYEIRPCGERVLMTLSIQCREFVDPLLETTWKQMRGQEAVDLPNILQKEALYCAIGRCANRMKDLIPFNEWLQANLASEARSVNPSYPILKRRIAWLIGKWVSSGGATANSPHAWDVLVYLLQDRSSGSDAVVRLTAAVAIRECIDTIDFDANNFSPYLNTVVGELVSLVAEADALESKRRISNTLNTVIECVGAQITPLMGVVAQPIPQLWMAAREDWLFKAALLETVSRLVTSTKENSASLTVLIVPMVRECFSSEAVIQLDEDGLSLWQVALQNATTIDSINGSPGLAELFPLALSLLANNLDLLGKIVSIVESYLLLDAPRLMQVYASEVFAAFLAGLTQALAVNVSGMLAALGLLLQIAPPSTWGEALHTSGLFSHFVKTLSDEKTTTIVLSQYIQVLARVAIADNGLFLQLMSLAVITLNTPEAQVWEDVLNQWWARFDNMYESRHRKLVAMGIARLVATGRYDVLDRLPTEVCNMWMDVFSELREATERAADEGPTTLTLYWDQQPDSLFAECKDTLEFGRRTMMYENDVVRTSQLTIYVRASIQEAEAACGGPTVFFERYLSKIDPLVMKQIEKELTGQVVGGSQ